MRKAIWGCGILLVLFTVYILVAGSEEITQQRHVDKSREQALPGFREEQEKQEEQEKKGIQKKEDVILEDKNKEEKEKEEKEKEEKEKEVEVREEGDWDLENGDDFFVEYRLYRDRVRSREIEMLESTLQDASVSLESRERAEKKMLELVDTMEKELIIENSLKARGYEDALFFYRNDLATVMVKADELSEEEILQVSNMAARAAGIEREGVKILIKRS